MKIFLMALVFLLCCLGPLLCFAWQIIRNDRARDENTLTINEMAASEEYIGAMRRALQSAGMFNKGTTPRQLADSLKLTVEDNAASDKLAKSLSRLVPADKSSNLNGKILVGANKDEDEVIFQIAHEIIHYIRDVGIGKKVVRPYAKNESGPHKEQIVDYMAAALFLPYDDVCEIKLKHNQCSSEELESILAKSSVIKGKVIGRRLEEVQTLMRQIKSQVENREIARLRHM